MKLLLDTHVFLWALKNPDRLPHYVRRSITSGHDHILVSVASLWEIAIKASNGRLPFKDSSELLGLEAWVHRMGAEILPVSASHALETWHLREWKHKDPFDRLLATQTMSEAATLVTGDVTLQKCPGLRWLWNSAEGGL